MTSPKAIPSLLQDLVGKPASVTLALKSGRDVTGLVEGLGAETVVLRVGEASDHLYVALAAVEAVTVHGGPVEREPSHMELKRRFQYLVDKLSIDGEAGWGEFLPQGARPLASFLRDLTTALTDRGLPPGKVNSLVLRAADTFRVAREGKRLVFYLPVDNAPGAGEIRNALQDVL
jgi:hypothetical protein